MKLLRKPVTPLMIFLMLVFSTVFNIASAQSDNYYNANNYEEQPSSVNINVFNDALTPYGSWVVSPSYGRCWVPHNHGFVPYSTGGHWIYSSYGWTWASSYNWGWAPFHYGRWAYDPIYGWMWVPGYEWGPAWVTWRSGGGYYGWTPLAPGMSIGVNIGIGVPYTRWVFAPCRYMGYSNINKYYVRPSHNTTVINNTTIINNTTVYNNTKFVAGPNRTEVERYSGRPVNQVNVVNASTPSRTVVNNNTVQMYRPGVQHKPTQAVVLQNSTSANNQLGSQTLNNTQANNNNQKQGQFNNSNHQQNNMPVPGQHDVISNNRPNHNRQQINNQPNANAGRNDRNQPQQNNTQRGNQPPNKQWNTDQQRDRINRQQEQRIENNQGNNLQREQRNTQQNNNSQQRMNMQEFNHLHQVQQPVHKQEGGNGNGRNRKL